MNVAIATMMAAAIRRRLSFKREETLDSDQDGLGDNADLDDDGDGVRDAVDDFPLDSSETKDTDGDGISNNADR